MGYNRKPQVWLAVALLPMLIAGHVIAQDKDPKDQPPKPKRPALLNYKPLKADAKDDELRKLQIDQFNAALGELKVEWEFIFGGKNLPSFGMLECASRFVQCGLELHDKPKDRIALLTDYLEMAKLVEEVYGGGREGEAAAGPGVHQARYFRIDAEIQLLKAQRAADKAKDK
jgi:hypothetical protein